MTATTADLVDRVARRTADRDMLEGVSPAEDWELALAINGLLATDTEESVAAATRLLDRVIETQGSEGRFGYDDPKPWLDDGVRAQSESPALIRGCLELSDRTGRATYVEAARRQVDFLLHRAARLDAGTISFASDGNELWVDSIYLLATPLARFGAELDVPEAIDEAMNHVVLQERHLQDPHADLFRHEWRERPDTYPESTFWSRGNGWAAAGLLDLLEHVPVDHPAYDTVHDSFTRLCHAVRPLQDASGFFHHILDDPWTAKETSGTLQFAYTFDRAVERGYLEDDAFAEAARRAFEACTGVVTGDGDVTRVAVPPGGPDVPLGVASYGQGWFLLAAAQLDG